ncbi:MAG: PD-(D/E)XK nuclease family protein [Armatimonadetes bacterium]|nr:PD-(D/E)XK nuclease family protein [Armatimonadota bacterium]
MRRPRFSPTRLEMYLTCPRAYHCYYDRGLRWGRLTPAHALGGSLHRALQHFHNAGGPRNQDVNALLAAYRASWVGASYATAADAAAHFAAGEAALRAYYEAARLKERETLWTERTLQYRYPEFVLFGKIDRLDRLPTGELEVVDYKSGRLAVSEEEVRTSLPLAVYQLLAARTYPSCPVRVAIYCLRTGESASVLRSPQELEAVEAGVCRTALTVLEDDEKEPTPGPACAACPFTRLCPEGRRYLADHTSAPAPSAAGWDPRPRGAANNGGGLRAADG